MVSGTGVDVAIVGGGAAGLSAGIAAAGAGARTILFDNRLEAGGTDEDGEPHASHDAPRGELKARAVAAGVDMRLETQVWGLFAGGVLGVTGSGGSGEVVAKRVVLATGSTGATDTPGGRHPEIKLALMAECAMGFSAALGGFVPGRERDLVTSESWILVAGDGAGLCTVEVAMAEGRLAGVSAAAGLGLGSNAALAGARAGLDRIAPERVAEVDALGAWYVQGSLRGPGEVGQAFDPGRGGISVMADGQIICQCEGVSEGAINAAMAEGARSLNDVKRRTRAGMGICQGIECRRSIVAMLSRYWGISEGRIVPMTARPPVRPIRLGDLARGPE